MSERNDLTTILETTDALIVIMDPTGRITYFNHACEELTGYSRDKVMGRFVWEFLLPERYVEPVKQVFANLVAEEMPSRFENPWLTKDGGERVIAWRNNVVTDAAGKVTQVIGTGLDITERKQAEETYRSLFDNMLNGFAYCEILLDKNNRPVDFVYHEVNDAFEKLTGLRKEDIVGKRVTEAIPGIEKVHTNLFDIYGKVALTGEPTAFDLHFEPLDIWLSISVYSPKRGFFVAVFENITERMELEERNAHLTNVLRSIRNVDQFITQERDRERLIQRACDLLVEGRGFGNAWILLMDEDGGLVSLVGAGHEEAYAALANEIKRGNQPPCVRHLMESQEPVVIYDDPKQHSECLLVSTYGVHAALAARLEHGGKTYGVLGVSAPPEMVHDEKELSLFQEVVGDIAYALRNLELEEERRQRTEDLAMIGLLNDDANQGDSLQEIIQLLSREMERLFSCYGVTVYLLSENEDYLVMQNLNFPQTIVNAVEKIIGKSIPTVKIHLGEGSLYRKTLQEGKPHLVNDPEVIRRLMAECTENDMLKKLVPKISSVLGIGSVINVPLVSEGEVLGLMDISRKEPFKEQDLRRFEIFTGTVTAIMKRRQTEEALRQSEELYHSLVEFSDTGVARFDLDGRRLFANNALARRYGVPVEQLMRGSFGDNVNAEEATEARRLFDECVRTGRPVTGTTSETRATSEVCHMRGIYTPIFDTDGKVSGVQVSSIDITEIVETQERLRQSEEQMRAVFDSVSEGLTISDLEGNVLRCNSAAMHMLGYSREEEIIGRNSLEFISPEDHPRAMANLKKTLEEEHSGTVEYTCLDKDGTELAAELSAALLRDESGNPTGFVGITRDITERKRVEEALRQSEEMYRGLLEATGAAVVRVRPDLKRTFVSSNVTEFTGRIREEFLGGIFGDGAVSHDRERIRKLVLETFRTEEGVSGVISRRQDGRYVMANWVPIKDASGKVAEVQVTDFDVTELVETRERLRQSEELYRSLVEATGSVVLRVDREGRRTFAGGDTLGVQSRTRGDFQTGEFGDMMVPEDREKAWALLRETFRTGKPVRGFIARQRVGGDIKYISANWEPIKDAAGNVVEIQTTSTDITNQIMADRRRTEAERLEALATMVGGIAHDINNVLAMVLLWANIGQMKTDDPEARVAMRNVIQAARDGAETMRRLRRFSSPRKASLAPVDLVAIVQESIEFTRPMWKDAAEIKDVHIKVAQEMEEVPEVMGNPGELREVVLNLIKNAIEAMPQGGTLTTRTYREGDMACVAISDTGVGISQENLSRILDPFFTTKGREESGLGLSAVRGIVATHGGEIDVQSVEGEGSTFVISLPLDIQDTEADKDTGEAARQGRMMAGAQYSILVVDDEPLVTRAVEAMLEPYGHRVTMAQDGLVALDTFRKGDFDVVLLDLGLPGMNGYTVAEEMKKSKPGIPIILVTGWGDDVDDDKVTAIGIERVIAKPFQPDELTSTIEEVLKPKRRGKRSR